MIRSNRGGASLGRAIGRILLLLTLACAPARAQDGRVEAVAACDSRAHRALDGRIGTWYQTTPDDRLLGETEVRAILRGCALWQDWHGASGGEGVSLNAYDAEAETWRHMWVNSSAIVLLAEGWTRDDETMSWRVSHISIPKEEDELERWVWSLREPIFNRVEASEDGGDTWNVVFDDRFHRWDGILPPNSRPSETCSLEMEHHALAFWTGAWIVHGEDGRRVGDSRVELSVRGCAVLETGHTSDLGRYARLMAFDRVAGIWRMLLVTDRGAVRVAHGVRDEGTVRWLEETAGDEASGSERRWILERISDDRIRWTTQISRDHGATWTNVEHVAYRRE